MVLSTSNIRETMRRFFATVLALTMFVLAPQAAFAQDARDRQQIEQVIERFRSAIIDKDKDAFMALFLKELDSSRTKCELKCPKVIMESTIGIGQAARLVGATVKTLQRWDREGKLAPAARTASNRRRYTESQLHAELESDHVAGAPDQD
jgi:hypothetical protein